MKSGGEMTPRDWAAEATACVSEGCRKSEWQECVTRGGVLLARFGLPTWESRHFPQDMAHVLRGCITLGVRNV